LLVWKSAWNFFLQKCSICTKPNLQITRKKGK
jgi:hypothetical protein